jgi:hypothetical protein
LTTYFDDTPQKGNLMINRTFKIFFYISLAFFWASHSAVFAPSARAAENWTSYENGRFGYSVEHPDIFDSVKDPSNGDGAEFSGAGGEYTLKVWGGFNVLEDDGNSLLNKCYDRIAHIVPGSTRSGEDFYSVAYSDDGGKDGTEHIFHEYGVVNAETMAGFILKYPKEEENRFAEIKSRMEGSLKIKPAAANKAGENVDLSAFELKGGKIFKNGIVLNCEISVVPRDIQGPIRFWSLVGPNSSETVRDSETGVWFFSGAGVSLTFVPLESVNEFQTITFSPNGEYFILGRGSGVRPDLAYEVYGDGTEKIADFSGIRDNIQWLDNVRFVLTRIEDSIREGGRYANLAYGLKLSVVLYDTVSKETTVLKEATDTHNYLISEVAGDGNSLEVTEQSVKSPADWGDFDKINERQIEVPIPAAG